MTYMSVKANPKELPVSDPLPDDRDLLRRAATGDRLAFDHLYRRHVRPVYWQTYAVVGNAYDAEDATQDVFITAWKKIQIIQIAGDSLLPWLLVTARYVGLNRRRQTQRDAARSQGLQGELVDPTGSAEAIVMHEELAGRVEKSIAALSKVDRQIYELCISDNRTYAEAAAELGITHGSVRNRVARIRQRFRADINVLRGTS